MLNITDLHAGYGELEILKGIDMSVKKGEMVAIIGPNGAGKSTLIKSVFNIANVTSGNITFNKKNLKNLKTHELLDEGISYVPQGRIIFGTLTVEENLKLGGQHIKNKSEINKRLQDIYKRFPILKERASKPAFGLSGGERQMLALGRALMTQPELLMLDEPSLGLSPKLQKSLFGLIKSLSKDGIAILIVEQNAKQAIQLADRTYLLEDGKVALEGGKTILKNRKIKNVYLGGRY